MWPKLTMAARLRYLFSPRNGASRLNSWIRSASPNLEDLKSAIEEIKPAHLAVAYAFNYLLIRDIHDVMTMGQLGQTPLNKFAGGV